MNYDELLKKLKEKADEFAVKIGDLNELNNAARERTEALRIAMDDFRGKPYASCPVCMVVTPPTHALLGCGHAFCEECAQRQLTRNRCYICRARIESIVRIFV
jgi:hypothetical protein